MQFELISSETHSVDTRCNKDAFWAEWIFTRVSKYLERQNWKGRTPKRIPRGQIVYGEEPLQFQLALIARLCFTSASACTACTFASLSSRCSTGWYWWRSRRTMRWRIFISSKTIVYTQRVTLSVKMLKQILLLENLMLDTIIGPILISDNESLSVIRNW